MSEENLSLEFVKCRLLDEETKRRGMESSTSSGGDAAFSGSKQVMKKKKLICFHCKKDGHKQVDCPERKKQDGQKGQQKSKAYVAEEDAGKGICFVGVGGGMDLPEDQRTR
uniref:CCHC-type domain-containing protein n=1 Tax=Aedes albopictus TaxID=7160 RepID=A0A023ED26_AEDAL